MSVLSIIDSFLVDRMSLNHHEISVVHQAIVSMWDSEMSDETLEKMRVMFMDAGWKPMAWMACMKE